MHLTNVLHVQCIHMKIVVGLCSFLVINILVGHLCSVLKGTGTVVQPVPMRNEGTSLPVPKVLRKSLQIKHDRYSHCPEDRNGSCADTERHRIIYNRLNEIIREKEALQHHPCQDISLAADATLSTLHLLDSPYKVYDIGDKIYVRATLFDSFGKQKSTGGDHLRARIWNSNASAPGVVYDHNNGSYTLIFEALWSGRSWISATISYTREAITAFYRITSEVVSLIYIMAMYKANNFEEDALCHPDVNHLITRAKYKDACNFTNLNSGMPWYCGKPKSPNLKCSDWNLLKVSYPGLPPSLSECEKKILGSRCHKVLTKAMEVIVKQPTHINGTENVQPNISCFKYNTTKLWYRKYTTGYFYKGRWTLTHCQGLQSANFQECLRNKILYLIGDSTVRQWYSDIRGRFHCNQFTENWTNEKWKRASSCKVEGYNLTVHLAQHSQPFYVGTQWTDPKHTLISISKRLDLISSKEDAIVLFHMFLHMRLFHHDQFRNKMQRIRKSVEKLLQRNSRVKIFIKMPHTYTHYKTLLNDFFGYVYTRIIFVTFKGLYDKMIVLNNRDITNSVASEHMHPDDFIVRSMVDQMFSYICE
ncbi:NXPE family member 3-like [Mercenaria mercenaria]|uniref:NXPE family member 3-like n=1 Tax=Mercenaria mercenaria TaxID=6596 RepID=UPI00234EB078|nr:NXPE family member 3-like [Mercenaria mercenaria]